MKITNVSGIPQQIVSAIKNDPYHHESTISVTQLIQPPKIYQLRKRHWDEIEEDASDRIWAFLGQVAHSILERADDHGAIHEERLVIAVHGWTLSGQTDCYFTHELLDIDGQTKYQAIPPTIRDYKFIKTSASAFPHPDWESQLNVLAYLWRKHGFPVEQLQIVAIYRDWSKMMVGREPNYPPAAQIIPQKMWTSQRTRDFIEARVLVHQHCEDLTDEQLPMCSPADQWRKPPKWAIMQPRSRRAKKLFNSSFEAEEFIDSLTGTYKKAFYIEFRPATATRCEHFCQVRPWCHQYAMESEEANRRKEQ